MNLAGPFSIVCGLLAVILLTACPDDPAPQTNTGDVVPADTVADSANDAAADPGSDPGVDPGNDPGSDTQADTTPDVASDTPNDSGGDPGTDTSADVAADVADVDSDAAAGDAATDAGDTSSACTATVAITTPTLADITYTGAPLAVAATVTVPPGDIATDYSVVWSSQSGVVLATTPVDATGLSTGSISGLGQGPVGLSARAQNAGGLCAESTDVPFIGCASILVETFDTAPDPSVWAVAGDAYWDAGGWLELTGLQQNQTGAFYYLVEKVDPGSASVRYRILTGGGPTGADGFAITFVDSADIPELQNIVANASNGGGLGYGYGGSYGPYAGAAFSVEIDTWYNTFNGNTELHTDPTSENHLEITLDLDPGNSVAFTEVPSIEDQVWHDVRVDVIGAVVRVWLDDVLVIDTAIAGLKFPGGYIVLSGSTGFYYNYHQFDDLEILHGCQAQSAP